MNMMMKRTPNLLKRSGALLLLAVLLLPACREGAQNPTLVLSDGIRFCESKIGRAPVTATTTIRTAPWRR